MDLSLSSAPAIIAVSGSGCTQHAQDLHGGWGCEVVAHSSREGETLGGLSGNLTRCTVSANPGRIVKDKGRITGPPHLFPPQVIGGYQGQRDHDNCPII